jgi:hypothetical protein
MTHDEMASLRADHQYWTAKHKALFESVELLAASARDLRSVVEAQVARDARSGRYLDMLARVLAAWAEDHPGNGEEKR